MYILSKINSDKPSLSFIKIIFIIASVFQLVIVVNMLVHLVATFIIFINVERILPRTLF